MTVQNFIDFTYHDDKLLFIQYCLINRPGETGRPLMEPLEGASPCGEPQTPKPEDFGLNSFTPRALKQQGRTRWLPHPEGIARR